MVLLRATQVGATLCFFRRKIIIALNSTSNSLQQPGNIIAGETSVLDVCQCFSDE